MIVVEWEIQQGIINVIDRHHQPSSMVDNLIILNFHYMNFRGNSACMKEKSERNVFCKQLKGK